MCLCATSGIAARRQAGCCEMYSLSTTMKRVLALGAVWLAACSSSESSSPAPAHEFPLPKIQAATAAQDWRNAPEVDPLVGFDYAILAPRAQLAGGPVGGGGQAEQLIASGAKVLFTVFPVFFWYQGQPLPEGDWDRLVNDLAVQYDAILKTPEGDWATTDALAGGFVLDFRNGSFVTELSQRVASFMQVGQGILEHGACSSMSWDPALQFLSEAEWAAWSEGFRSYFLQLRALRPDWEIVAVCDRWGSWTNDTYDGLFFENIGSSLNPVGQKVYDELAKAGSRNVVALYDPTTPALRRGAAVMAVLWDALFLDGREATVAKDPEHFQIGYGSFADPPTEVSAGIWTRHGTRGFVVGNFSSAPYSYTDPIEGRSFTVAPNDGLAVQWANIETGAPLDPWITNEGQ